MTNTDRTKLRRLLEIAYQHQSYIETAIAVDKDSERFWFDIYLENKRYIRDIEQMYYQNTKLYLVKG